MGDQYYASFSDEGIEACIEYTQNLLLLGVESSKEALLLTDLGRLTLEKFVRATSSPES